jgi:Protein of unknown function (DUF1360)
MREQPPYSSYSAIMAASRAVSRSPAAWPASSTATRPARPRSTVLLSAATFEAARTTVRDEVTSFIREPFVKGEAHSGDEEEPVEGGMEQAMGELVTCSRCAGTWAAAGLAVAQILAPRFRAAPDLVARRRRRERLPSAPTTEGDEALHEVRSSAVQRTAPLCASTANRAPPICVSVSVAM